uniref:Reverse transcriptase n=1 Tax=Panagrellus redivivus TaxID=6233 RepID=A0A7E4W2D5_PANRE
MASESSAKRQNRNSAILSEPTSTHGQAGPRKDCTSHLTSLSPTDSSIAHALALSHYVAVFDSTYQDLKQCRKCEYPRETLPHVLNQCHVHKVTMTNRHNAVLSRLQKPMKKGRDVRILTNQPVPKCDSNLRPDIVLINDTSKILTIIDVTISFENGPDAFKKAREKENRSYKTFNDAIIIGSLAAYDPANEACIRRLGIPHKYAVLMKRLMVNDVIKRCLDLYVEHVTGIRQYQSAT